jgi:hypothetical protein
MVLGPIEASKTINDIAQSYEIQPVKDSQWKKPVQDNTKSIFEGKRGPKPSALHKTPEVLFIEIGKFKVELDLLKKNHKSARRPLIDLYC